MWSTEDTDKNIVYSLFLLVKNLSIMQGVSPGFRERPPFHPSEYTIRRFYRPYPTHTDNPDGATRLGRGCADGGSRKMGGGCRMLTVGDRQSLLSPSVCFFICYTHYLSCRKILLNINFPILFFSGGSPSPDNRKTASTQLYPTTDSHLPTVNYS